MLYRRFGKTDLAMPVISFGCMRSMQSWQDIPAAEVTDQSQQNLKKIIAAALDSGINHFETAHGYGTSEQQLGRILPELKRDDFILQTKVVPSADADEFTAKVRTSLERLRVKRVDLLGLHGINDHRSLWYCCRKNGCLEAARKLQDEGLVDHVGLSSHAPLDVLLDALSCADYGGFDYANIHWYYILDQNRTAIEYAASRDIGIFIISPSDKGGHLHSPSEKLQELCSPFSPMLFNDLYCLDNPGVCTIGIGASEPHHFDEHLNVLSWLEHDDRETFNRVERRLRDIMCAETGFERPDHLWESLPTWDRTPGNINIRMVLWLANLFEAWDMKTYGKERYSMLNHGSNWVPGNDAERAGTLDFSQIPLPEHLSAEQLQAMLVTAHDLLKKDRT